MTSKEAIKIARNVFLFENGEETDEWSRGVIEGLKRAENDLEILEILRKHLTTIQITGFGTEKYKDIVVIPYEDEEDNEKVKEWLEKKD